MEDPAGTGPANSAGPAAGPGEGIVERAARHLSQAALLTMLAVVGLEVVSRAVFNYSFQIADEVGGYMLVALAFFSLSVCQVHNSFHGVEFIQNRLPGRARLLSSVLFDLVMLGCAAILLWQMVRYEISLWNAGSRAGTYLRTPLWLPALPMALGMAAFAWSLLRTLRAHLLLLQSGEAPEKDDRNGS